MPSKQKSQLEEFFVNAEDQTSRERIFFHRLSFDLKISAAKAGYHLHIYEPDVDRDGFDIIVGDEDTSRRIQTKAVLSSVGTSSWEILTDLLRPDIQTVEHFHKDLPDAGQGGGVVLIEIIEKDAKIEVVYSYTDHEIIQAIAENYLVEQPPLKKKRGPKPKSAQQEAKECLEGLWQKNRKDKLSVSRKLFIPIANPDGLLAIIGLRAPASTAKYGSFAIKQNYAQVGVGSDGKWDKKCDIVEANNLHYHIKCLTELQESPYAGSKSRYFSPFDMKS